MSSVHLMLSSDSFTLPKPGKPAIQGRVGRWTTTSTSAFTNTKLLIPIPMLVVVATLVLARLQEATVLLRITLEILSLIPLLMKVDKMTCIHDSCS